MDVLNQVSVYDFLSKMYKILYIYDFYVINIKKF